MTGSVTTACKLEQSACGEEVRRFSESKKEKKKMFLRGVWSLLSKGRWVRVNYSFHASSSCCIGNRHIHAWPWSHYADCCFPLLPKFPHLLEVFSIAHTESGLTASCTVAWWMSALVTCILRANKSPWDTSCVCTMLFITFSAKILMNRSRELGKQSKEEYTWDVSRLITHLR
jgi:hypothetical protein